MIGNPSAAAPCGPLRPRGGGGGLVALGIDYNIFLMTRVREEAIRRDARRGALAGLAATGGVITSAGGGGSPRRGGGLGRGGGEGKGGREGARRARGRGF